MKSVRTTFHFERRMWSALAVLGCGFVFQPSYGQIAIPAQVQWLRQTTFEGMPALTFSSGALDLIFLPQGTSIASITLHDDVTKLNPLWTPARLDREQGHAVPATSMTGHILCLDGFGPPSQEERQAGLSFNGEAHTQTFNVQTTAAGSTEEVDLTATLPLTQEAVRRTYRMVQGESVIHVDTIVENLLAFDRPLNWGEHATVGAPFVQSGVTVFDLSGKRSQTTPYTSLTTPMDTTSQRHLASDRAFIWPIAPSREGGPVDMRLTPEHAHYVDHTATLMDPAQTLAWTTALNLKQHLVFGYVFRREDYPWVQNWVSSPSNGNLVRGMEFATQPFSADHHDTVTMGSMFGTPTYRWLPAKSKVSSRFLIFYARVPDGMQQVDTIELKQGSIVLHDLAHNKELRLASSIGLD